MMSDRPLETSIERHSITPPYKRHAVLHLIEMFGHTSGLLSGTVISTNLTAKVETGSGETKIFRDQIQHSMMTSPGDSGSIVTQRRKSGTSSRVAGLHFAGNGKTGAMNKLEYIGRAINDGIRAMETANLRYLSNKLSADFMRRL